MPHAAPLRSFLSGGLLAALAGMAGASPPASTAAQDPSLLIGVGVVVVLVGWVSHRRWRHARALRAERDALAQLEQAQQAVGAGRHARSPRPAEDIDTRTGALTRAAFTEALDALLAQARQALRPVVLLVIDVDHFRTLNDTHGHAAGDAALRLLTGLVQAQLGDHGLLGRFGGDEFLAAVAGHDAPAGETLAERIRFEVVARGADLQPPMPELSVSIGVAVADPVRGYDAASLFHRADTALYRAKRCGRNRVLADDPARVGTGTETDDRRLRPWHAPAPD